jgi:hypothetical protein
MSWIRIDDRFADHPKFLDVSEQVADAALALWLRALAYASRHNTSGFIVGGALHHLCASESRDLAAAELVRVGLWETTVRGWRIVPLLHGDGREMTGVWRDEWSRKNYAAAYERDGSVCRYCGSTDDLTVDHVVPRARGGSDNLENLAVACRRCNSRKGARTPDRAGMTLRPVGGGN